MADSSWAPEELAGIVQPYYGNEGDNDACSMDITNRRGRRTAERHHDYKYSFAENRLRSVQEKVVSAKPTAH